MLRQRLFSLFQGIGLGIISTGECLAEGGGLAPAPHHAVEATGLAMRTIDLNKVFAGAPLIYSLLGALSIAGLAVWIYTLVTWRSRLAMPEEFLQQIKEKIGQGDLAGALKQCQDSESAIASILASGLKMHRQGGQAVFQAVEAEGKRLGLYLWQKVSLLNDIAVTAPMLGLLGTVLGIFYGFYDKNRSFESLITVFDGLGIAIGTTVIGLVVAILVMILHATLKLWATSLMSDLETQALEIAASVIDSAHSSPSQQQ